MFGLFHLYSKKKKKTPVVNKYHQNKVLSVSKNAKKIIWVQHGMNTQFSFKV
ncbi:unnamed protein product [Staurois parvus]|uniref:Uncharacterized protein n=1 Tax=Staurois parvus TaxID=386267 RepID=A0ABN9FQK3_9NEOB|nr:unnamed protein product [Staurois parvus]